MSDSSTIQQITTVCSERKRAVIWIIVVLLSTLAVAGSNILDKHLMKGKSAPPFTCAASFSIVSLPIALIGLMVLPFPPMKEALLGMGAGSIFILAAWQYYDTVARSDISRIVPLMRLTSVQLVLFAIVFLGDTLSFFQWIAFAVLLGSGLVLNLDINASRLTLHMSALRIIPVTTLLAVSEIMTAHVYRTTSMWHGIVWECVGISITVGVAALFMAWSGQNLWATATWATWRVLILGQGLRKLASLAPAWAIASGVPIALLTAISGTRCAWVWLLAILVLGERMNRSDLLLKGSGIIGMTVGIYWLA
jgi:uncharacterized membrane protein